ncbi:hypothetical protein AVEN_8057-1 [Araneus ventricosus]|uniref:Uncharacterized protein n=1 Tax=Araneus ventricosus TaxID=182803 RepID=A0A4Y2TYP0_ARAVE|nr:hypothetical protein AVEN_8057-1 [Araneus ventricosus]
MTRYVNWMRRQTLFTKHVKSQDSFYRGVEHVNMTIQLNKVIRKKVDTTNFSPIVYFAVPGDIEINLLETVKCSTVVDYKMDVGRNSRFSDDAL